MQHILDRPRAGPPGLADSHADLFVITGTEHTVHQQPSSSPEWIGSGLGLGP